MTNPNNELQARIKRARQGNLHTAGEKLAKGYVRVEG